MAYPILFDGCNKVYKAPSGRDDVGDLAVYSNGSCIVSCWQLTPEELEEVNRTGCIFMSSMSGDVLFPQFVGSRSVVRSVIVDYGGTF